MHKNILAIGITILLIITVVTPMTLGYNDRTSDTNTPDNEYTFDRYLYPEYYDCYSVDEIDDYVKYQNTDVYIDYEPGEPTKPLDGPPMDSPWPMFQHDIRHTGRSQYGANGTLGVLKWKFRMDGSVFSSPVIDEDETIYIGGANDFYAINPDGSLEWTYEFRYGWVESAAAIDENGTIYFGTAYAEDNYFYALHPNGTLKWKYRTGHHVKSSPAIGSDGTIYFGSDNKNIYALYPNGTLRWKFKTGGVVHTSPAIDDDGIIYCGSSDHYLYALYPNGTLKWKYNAGCRIGGDPTIGDDRNVYFGGVEEAALYALYPNGTKKWKLTLGSNVVSSPALAEDGTIYVAAYKFPSGAYIYSINPDGFINWRYEVEDVAMSASPAIDKYGIIYIGGWGGYEWGNLYALNPDGTLRWIFTTGDTIQSSAAIGEDGTIYFGSWDEYLYAIEVIDNDPPEQPSIDGPTSGKPHTEYTYVAVTSDPDGDNVSYFFDWGDDTSSGWTEFVSSGTSMSRSHTWLKQGTYKIKCKAKDSFDVESEWAELEVIIPRGKTVDNSLFLRFLERFPLLERLLGWIRGI